MMDAKAYFSKPRIIALSMMFVSIAFCIAYSNMETIWETISVIGMIIFGLFGLFIVVNPRIDKYAGMGLVTMGFGILMILKFTEYPHVSYGTQAAIHVAQMALGVYCVLLSFPVFCGSRYDVRRVNLVSLIYIISMGVPLALEVVLYGQNFFVMLWTYMTELLTIIPFILYLIFANNATIGYKTRKAMFKQNVKSLSNYILADPNAYVMRNDMKNLMNSAEWEPYVEGYITSRISIPIYCNGKKNYIEGQKWTDGTIRTTINQGDTGTIMTSTRVEMDDIIPDNGDYMTCKSMTFYTKSGFFIRVMVKDDQVKREVSRRMKFLYKLMGYNISDM